MGQGPQDKSLYCWFGIQRGHPTLPLSGRKRPTVAERAVDSGLTEQSTAA